MTGHPARRNHRSLRDFFDEASTHPESLAGLLAGAFPLRDFRETQRLELEGWRLEPDEAGGQRVMVSVVMMLLQNRT